jgi:hypothetical protein
VFIYQMPVWTPLTAAVNGAWLALVLLAIVVRPVWANYAVLGALILLYAFMFGH